MNKAVSGKSKRVTIRLVAEDAGVSVTAVSNVLRDAYGVSEEMKLKVRASIEKLGYRPSFAARSMRGRTKTVGVLLIDLHNPFLADVVDGLKAALDEAGYRMMMSVGHSDSSIERRLVDSMIDMAMDAVILVAPRLSPEVLAHYGRQVPIVVIGHHEPGATDFDTVNSDDEAGARLATETLIARGLSEVTMLTAPPRDGVHEVAERREIGYRATMQDAGLSPRVIRSSSRDADDMDEFREVIAGLSRPHGLFCWSDIHGVPLVHVARRAGVSIPGDLAVVGYDNSALASLPMTLLTSIDQQPAEIGRAVVAAILERLAGRGDARHILIEPRLVQRETC